MKVKIFLVILILITSSIFLFIFNENGNKKQVNVNFTNSTDSIHKQKISVVKKDSANDNKVIADTTNIRLKEGDYTLIYKNEGFKDINRDFSVADKHTTIDLYLEYSDEKLNSLLEEQTVEIQRTINSSINIPSGYTISNGYLIGLGDWYVSTIANYPPEDSERYEEVDTWKIVVGKENGNWKLYTKEPMILLNNKDYPEIPLTVLERANSQY